VRGDFRGFKLSLRQAVVGGRRDTSRLTCRYQVTANILCGSPASWMLTAGCAHEHVVPSLACGYHAEQARVRDAGPGITCMPCADGPEPHSCRVLIEYTALDAP
jgi:hypothetical protein